MYNYTKNISVSMFEMTKAMLTTRYFPQITRIQRDGESIHDNPQSIELALIRPISSFLSWEEHVQRIKDIEREIEKQEHQKSNEQSSLSLASHYLPHSFFYPPIVPIKSSDHQQMHSFRKKPLFHLLTHHSCIVMLDTGKFL